MSVGDNIHSLLCTTLHFPAVCHQHLINNVINAQTDAMVVKDTVITLWLSIKQSNITLGCYFHHITPLSKYFIG